MADIKSPIVGGETSPDPILTFLDVAANTLIEGGRLVWSDASGYAIPSSSAVASSKCWGICDERADNRTSNSPYGAAGAKKVPIRQGVALCTSSDGTGVRAAVGSAVYLVSDTGTGAIDVSTDDAGGTRPLVGGIVPNPRGSTDPSDASKVPVRIAQLRPDVNNPELAATRASAFTARNVATSMAAFAVASGVLTASANGALGAQDGVTNAVGDVIVIPAGTIGSATVSAADSGPWKLTAIGGASAKFTAVRPDWWTHGSYIVPGALIEIGGEGTLFAGTAWKTWAAGTAVIGTDDPTLYPLRVTQQITLVAGTKAITNVPIRSTSKVGLRATLAGGTPAGTTTAFQRKLSSGATAGALGTASITVEAQSVAGTIVNTDVSVLNVEITNG